MALFKKFESFIEDRERERAEIKEREREVIATFIDEPKGVDVKLRKYDNSTELDPLEVGKSIVNEFPVDLVEEPMQPEFSTESDIINQFPVEVVDTVVDDSTQNGSDKS